MKTIYSFSVKPTDIKNINNIMYIKQYMAKTSIKFSPIVLKALDNLVTDLKTKDLK